jgi:ribosomal protein S18 acetylase RimI-like enzyme
MVIKRLELKDVNFYREIRLEALKSHPEAFSTSYESEVTAPIEQFESKLEFEHFYIFGAFEDDKLIGTVTLILETKTKLSHKAHIVAMYVRPHFRRLGTRRNLMIKAIQKAKGIERIEQVYLTVTASNEPAKKLYQSLGFKTYGIDKRGLKIEDSYFDDELMVLVL